MKLNFFISTVILLVAFLQRYDCRAVESPVTAQAAGDPQSDLEQQSPPMLLRLGEEYFIRLGNQKSLAPQPEASADATSSTVNRALQLHLTQRLLRGRVGNVGRFASGYAQQLHSVERGRRSEEPPISLDLTFHLLREVLEMARAEQLAQQAHSNRKMMDIFGK